MFPVLALPARCPNYDFEALCVQWCIVLTRSRILRLTYLASCNQVLPGFADGLAAPLPPPNLRPGSTGIRSLVTERSREHFANVVNRSQSDRTQYVGR